MKLSHLISTAATEVLEQPVIEVTPEEVVIEGDISHFELWQRDVTKKYSNSHVQFMSVDEMDIKEDGQTVFACVGKFDVRKNAGNIT